MDRIIKRLKVYALVISMLAASLSFGVSAKEQTSYFDDYSFTEVIGFENVTNPSELTSVDNAGFFEYSVSALKGFGATSSLCHTHRALSPNGSYNKTEIKLAGDSGSVKNWSGASELWFYMDASDYCLNDFKLLLSIKENVSGKPYQFSIAKGNRVLFQKGFQWEAKEVKENGTLAVSAGFKGFVRIIMNGASLYNLSGGRSYEPAFTDVVSISVAACGDKTSLGKSVYFDSFGIAGKINGISLPANPGAFAALAFHAENTEITAYKNSASDLIDLSIGSVSGYNRYFVSSKPAHGAVNISRFSGIAVYTPDSGYNGPDSFEVSVYSENYSIGKTTVALTVKNEVKSDAVKDIDATAPKYPQTKPADKALAPPDEERAVSHITDMGLTGYVGENLQGNIDNWLTEVLEKNPNIIDQIAEANVNGIIDITAIIYDDSGMRDLGVFSYGVEEYSAELGRALVVNHLTEFPEYREMAIRFLDDATSSSDWTGAEQFWVYIDISEFGTNSVPFGLGFQENNLNEDGTFSGKIESWSLKTGSKVYLYNTETASGWQEATVAASSATSTANKGRAVLPAGFKGWLRADLTADNFSIYYTTGSSMSGTIDKKSVYHYQVVIEGNSTSVGKSAYIASFGVAGTGVGADNLPVAVSGKNYSFKETWSIDAVSTTENKKDDSELWPWYGEFAGKVLTGMAYMYRAVPDSNLYAAASEFAGALIAAQKADGYTGIYTGMGVMGGGSSNWDVWNHYHAIYGLYSWYEASGDTDALNAAVKAAGFVYNYFTGSGKSYGSAGSPAMNLAISHAFAILYKETGDKKYLNAAKQIVVEEWPSNGDWMNGILAGLEYYQTSPRWEALHTVMTLGTLYEETGDKAFYKALEEIWWSVTKTDRLNHGGFSTAEQASGSPFATGAIETCCTVAYMALGTEYLQLSHNSLVADELELSFFNCMLGALMQNDREVTYNTPMDGTRIDSVTNRIRCISKVSPDFTCCQANCSRGLAQFTQWAVLTNGESLYINYYGPGKIKTKTPSGTDVTITEDTVYPLNGQIKITLSGLSAPESFNLCLRIPSWSGETAVTVNGQKQSGVKSGSYCVINRQWKNSDTIEISLEMPVHYWLGEEAFEGRTSVYYGPILMALDGNFTASGAVAGVTLQTSDLEQDLVVSDGSNYGCWLIFDTYTVDNKPVRLVDFASAGQNGQTYISWLTVNSNLNYRYFVKGGSPVWNNSAQILFTFGDVNGDGKISASDALLALQSSVGKIKLDETQASASDVNGDGSVTAADALLILQYSVGKISSFPAEGS